MNESITGKLILKSGCEKPVINRHPWVFSDAIHHIEGEPEPAEHGAWDSQTESEE